MKPQKYKFVKDPDGKWYIDLPEYVGPRADLQMVMGADTMLDMISNDLPWDGTEVHITMSDEPFDQSVQLRKLHDTPEYGGAMYHLEEWKGVRYNAEMWLCEVVRFVFGSLPETIYIE